MSDRREHLGELGCTRDGYWLVAAAWALGLALGSPLLLLEGAPGWARALNDLGQLNQLLFLIGLGALAPFPLGPLPRWLKWLLASYLLLELAWSLTESLSRPENHPWLTGFNDLMERHLIMRMPFPPVASFYLGSLGFCLVRSLWLPALAWGLVAAHSSLVSFYPGYYEWQPAPWSWGGVALPIVAALLTALALGARIRATTRA